MSSKHVVDNEVSDGQHTEGSVVDEDGFEVVDEVAERERNLRPTVGMEIRAKVDTNHPDARREGMTLAAEERMDAREWEIERTQTRWDRSPDSDREARTSAVAAQGSVDRRRAFKKRAANVDPSQDPDGPDAREQLGRSELAAVNREAARMADRLERWSRAAISRRLAERVVEGMDVVSAVVATFEELKQAPGQVVPIAAVEEVTRREVSVEGEVLTLWDPSSPTIQAVGLLGDESGKIRFTIWRKSDVTDVAEGDRVRFRAAAKNWYNGRCSIALTGWSEVDVLDRGRWWSE